jgi:hypothetical protein
MSSKTEKPKTITMKRLEEFGNIADFGLAVVILKGRLRKKFWDELSFESWHSIYEAAEDADYKLQDRAIEGMIKKGSFEKWLSIFRRGSLNGARGTARIQLHKLAKTPDQKIVLYQIEPDKRFEILMQLRKMV